MPVGTFTDRSLRVAGNRSETKRVLQDQQRQWITALAAATGRKLSQLATEAGVSDTTLTRLVNNPTYDGLLSAITIKRLSEAYKVPGPEEYASGRRLSIGSFFAEAELLDPLEDAIVSAIIGGRAHLDAWRLKTQALEAIGYLPGDIVIVDTDAAPRPQDAVCAQVVDRKGGSAETIWRVYDPPYLIGHAIDRASYKPVLVDNDRVTVRGVVVTSLRPHPLSATR